MEKSKGALKSFSILGNLSSIGTLLGLITMVMEVWEKIPPELIEETKTFLLVTVVAVFQQFLALLGRWKAVTKIKGLW